MMFKYRQRFVVCGWEFPFPVFFCLEFWVKVIELVGQHCEKLSLLLWVLEDKGVNSQGSTWTLCPWGHTCADNSTTCCHTQRHTHLHTSCSSHSYKDTPGDHAFPCVCWWFRHTVKKRRWMSQAIRRAVTCTFFFKILVYRSRRVIHDSMSNSGVIQGNHSLAQDKYLVIIEALIWIWFDRI